MADRKLSLVAALEGERDSTVCQLFMGPSVFQCSATMDIIHGATYYLHVTYMCTNQSLDPSRTQGEGLECCLESSWDPVGQLQC